MSTFTSPAIRKRDANPPERTNPEEKNGGLKAAIGVSQIPVAGAGTFVKLIAIPSNARLHTLDYSSVTLGTSTVAITAFYPTVVSQGGAGSVAKTLEATPISSSTFIAGVAGIDTSAGWTTCLGLASTPALGVQDNPLWQLLGLTEDPEGDIDLGFSVTVATSEAGYVGLKATYVD